MSECKNVVVTGISSDLGGVLARRFAENPTTRVIGTMRRKRLATDTFAQNIHVIDECDLTRHDHCERLASQVNAECDGSFGLIHSVGDFWNHVPFAEFRPEQAQRMFASHVTTFYTAVHALIPYMRSRKAGSCIAFSCNSVRYNYPWMAAFTASKAAIESLVRSLAHEYSGDGLRFNCLVLASLQTTKVHDSKPRGDYDHFIPPDDIFPVARFLLSDEAYLVNGGAVNLFRHSDHFYDQGYFERIAR